MKYCIDGRQSYQVLNKTDEIKVSYRDKGILMDFIEKIPDKMIILDIPYEEQENVNIDELLMYKEKFAEFCVAVQKLEQFLPYAQNAIDWYWPYPITSFFELRNILKLNPKYILLGMPLTFSLKKVKEIAPNIKLRVIANNAMPKYLLVSSHKDNAEGFWIRPEDIKTYDEFISVIEFDVDYGNYKKEETLLDIYKSEKWPGNINLLIDNLNSNIDNRAFPDLFGETRLNCEQKCMKDGSCKYCFHACNFAKNLRNFVYERKKKNTN